MALSIVAKYAGRIYRGDLDKSLQKVQETRPGIVAIYEGAIRLVNEQEPTDLGLSAFSAIYIYSSGEIAAEVGLFNDAMFRPMGLTKVDWGLLLNGNVIASEKDRTLADQAGIAIKLGKLKYAPREDYQPSDWMPRAVRYRMALPKPEAHVDPTTDTHTTGSPRNEFYNENVTMFLTTNDSRWLDLLHDFSIFQAQRPYHFSDDGAVIYDYKKLYSAKKAPSFGDGKVVVPKYPAIQESFGRTKEPKFAQLPIHPNGGAMNGGDLEHMTVDKLYHCYMALGSRLARRELLQCCNWMASSYPFQNGDEHHLNSERVVGWVAKAWALGADVERGARFFDMLEQLVRQTSFFARELPIPYIMGSQAPDLRHIPNQKFACVWQNGIAVHGLATYIRMANKYGKDSSAVSRLIKLATVGNLAEAYMAGLGFCNDYGIEWHANEPNAKHQWLGTSIWTVAGLADAVMIGALDDSVKAEAIRVVKEGFAYLTAGGPSPLTKWPDLYVRSLIFADKYIIQP